MTTGTRTLLGLALLALAACGADGEPTTAGLDDGYVIFGDAGKQ